MRTNIFVLYLLFVLSTATNTHAQYDFGDSDLVDSISQEWLETSLNKNRIIVFNKNGKYTIYPQYGSGFKINGRYWLYQNPKTASKALREFVENEQIKGELAMENPFTKYELEGLHPDMETHHGFIMEHVYPNGVIRWSAGVWRINEGVLEMVGGSSRAGAVANFYFFGEKEQEDGW